MDSLYTSDQLLQIWEKGVAVLGYDSHEYRKDVCGAWMHYSKYGDRNSKYGWEIDHIYPRKKAEEHHHNADVLANLRPMQWENNQMKGLDYPEYKARVRASNENDGKNVDDIRKFHVNEQTQQILSQYFEL